MHLGQRGWDFMEDLLTVEFVSRWEPQGSPAGDPGDTAWECSSPNCWRTWLKVHQGAGDCCGGTPRELAKALLKPILTNQQVTI